MVTFQFYSKGLDDTSYKNSLFFTNKGYTPFMFDDIADFKTLIIRMAYIRGCPSKFKKLADELFLKVDSKFKFDRETGWIKTTISSAARIACKKIEQSILGVSHEYKDKFIYKELDNIIDLFGILITLPVGPNNFKIRTLDEKVSYFLKEWDKIDVWFGDTASDDKLNIIKKMLATINNLIIEYSEEEFVNHNEEMSHKFKLQMFEIFDAFGNFVHVQDLNYGELLCSIIEISNYIEHTLYTEVQRYKKLFNLSFLDNWTLFQKLEDLIGENEPFRFKNSDSIVVFDCMDKTTSSFELKDDEFIEALNLSSNIKNQINLFNNLSTREFGEEE